MICILLTSILLPACTPPPAPQIRIGTNIWAGYEPLYLARSLGLFEGTGISLLEYESSGETMRALRHGSIEAGALTLDEVLTLAHDGMDLRIVMLLDISDGADAVIAHADITDAAALRGRAIGVESSALGGYMLTRLLDKAGLKLDDVQVVPLSLNQHEKAFIDRTVDAVVTFEPVSSRLQSIGGKVIFDSSQISGEIVDVLAVRAEFIAAHPDALNALAEKWFQTLAYMQANPDIAAQRMQPRLRVPSQAIATQFKNIHMGDRHANEIFFDDTTHTAVKKASLLMQVMRAQGLLNHDIDVDRLFSGSHTFASSKDTP